MQDSPPCRLLGYSISLMLHTMHVLPTVLSLGSCNESESSTSPERASLIFSTMHIDYQCNTPGILRYNYSVLVDSKNVTLELHTSQKSVHPKGKSRDGQFVFGPHVRYTHPII
jgi:hypothetical protein